MNQKIIFSFSSLLKKYGIIFFGAVISLSPLILFELRHNLLNTKGILSFVFSDKVSYTANTGYLDISSDVFFRTFARLVFNYPSAGKAVQISEIQLLLWGGFAMIITISALVILLRQKNGQAVLILSLWLLVSVFLLGFYKKEIFDYLFTFIFPLPFLIIGSMLAYLYKFSFKRYRRSLFVSVSLLLFSSIFILNLTDLPLLHSPNNQRKQVKTIAEFIILKTNKEPYNFALISSGNSDHAYRYFLDFLGHPPQIIENLESDPQRKTVTDQLLIVCEEPCQPLGHPLHEVASFGRAEIVGEWSISVVKVYKLVPYKE